MIRLKGDGGLVEFGGAVDALAAAIDFQQAMVEANRGQPEDKAIVFRVGLHLGDVIVEGDDIYGDDVNVAARLEAEAPPGGIVVSRAVREAVEGRLKATLQPLGDLALKSIVRPIRAFQVKWSAEDWPAYEVGTTSSAPASPLAAASKLHPPRLSIVVLPFANMGADAEQEYFVDGVTESLTTDLSRLNEMLVIGRSTAFTYKGKRVDVTQIGRELGVRYVLEGSVQRGGNRQRVNVQLIETANGYHLWAERFEKPVTGLFDMQDEIVARLASELKTQLFRAEADRAVRAPNPDSLDFLFQGVSWLRKGLSPQSMTRAAEFFERALAVDPGNTWALWLMADVDLWRGMYGMVNDRSAHFAAAEANLTRVLSSEPNNAQALLRMGGF